MILFSNCGAGAGLVKFAREGREMKGFRWIGQNTKQNPSVGRSLFKRKQIPWSVPGVVGFKSHFWLSGFLTETWLGEQRRKSAVKTLFAAPIYQDWRAFSVSCWTTWLWCESNVARATEVSGCQVLAPRLEEQEHLSWCKLYTGWCTLCTGSCALHLTTLYLSLCLCLCLCHWWCALYTAPNYFLLICAKPHLTSQLNAL